MRDGNMQARPNAEPPFRRLGGVTHGCRPRPRSGSCPQGQQQRAGWHRIKGVSDTGPASGWAFFHLSGQLDYLPLAGFLRGACNSGGAKFLHV